MLFVNTKRFAERVVATLERHGLRVAALTGDLPQARRLKILSDFKSGRLPLLVATDVASRGLHIEGVTHVVNVDLPQDPEDYVHRIGRTARAGAAGKAISLADENYVFSLAAIEKLIGMKIPTASTPTRRSSCGRRRRASAGGAPVRRSAPPRPAEDEDERPPLPRYASFRRPPLRPVVPRWPPRRPDGFRGSRRPPGPSLRRKPTSPTSGRARRSASSRRKGASPRSRPSPRGRRSAAGAGSARRARREPQAPGGFLESP